MTFIGISFHFIIRKSAEKFFYWRLLINYNIIYISTWLINSIIICVTSKVYVFDNKKKIAQKNIE